MEEVKEARFSSEQTRSKNTLLLTHRRVSGDSWLKAKSQWLKAIF